MAKTLAELLAGEDMEGGEAFCDGLYNNLKNHWRAVAAPGTPSPGMLFSDEDDEKLYHRWAASWGEVVQGNIPLSDELAVIVGTDSDGKFYYDEAVNDEVVIEARAHADTEGITVSLLETNQRFRIRQNADYLSARLGGTDVFINWSDGQLEFQTDEADAMTVLRIKPNGTSEVSQLDFYDADGIRLSLYTAADRAYIESVGGVLGINPSAAQNVAIFEGATSGETPELLISGFRAADALRTLEIGVGVDAADTASFDGVSNYVFDGHIGGGTMNPKAPLHIIEAGGALGLPTTGYVAIFQRTDTAARSSGISIVGGNTGDSLLAFGDTEALYDGGIIYEHDNRRMLFRTAAIDLRMVIDSIGNIGIGTGTFGANAVMVQAILSGTAPTTSPPDMSQMWSADVLGVANKAGPHWRSEENGMYAWHGGAGTINSFTYQADVADDGIFTLPAITDSAWGFIQAGDNEEYAFFTIDNDGDVTLISNSANVVANVDTDGNLVLGTAATQEPLQIRNRLGGVKNINLIIWYS